MDLSLVSRRHLNEAFLGNRCNGELLESALLFRACFLIDGEDQGGPEHPLRNDRNKWWGEWCPLERGQLAYIKKKSSTYTG